MSTFTVYMSEPSQLLFELAERDTRMYCALDLNSNKFIYTNPAFQAFFDLKSEEDNPSFLYNLIHEDDRAYVKAMFDTLEPLVLKEKMEFRVVLRGILYYLSISMLLFQNTPNDAILTGYIEDITGFKQTQDTLLALSNKKNAVLNILSHDLAGPLGSIQNYTYLLAKKVNPEDKLTNTVISSIDSISKRCIKLIQEFVKMEFLESTGVDLVKSRYNLVKIVGSFMEDYLRQQHALRKEVVFTYEQDLVFAEVDDTKLMQVINNLLSNALKFTPDQGKIEVMVSKEGENARIVVKDNGIGIPEKFHATLFEKFSKARRPGIKGENSVGLGMSIIKTIVEWHHGQIWFESEEGKGTAFYIEIPGCE
jgi:two-component system sensor histidine kinase VicK